MTDGTIWGTGNNTHGQLGISSGNTTSVSVLTQMDTTTNITINGKTPKYISCGGNYTIVLMTDGTIWGTGNNTNGQLGIEYGNTTSVSVLTQMDTTNPTINGKTPKYISCGENYTMVLMTDGTICGTGFNGFGQLGIGNIDSVSTLNLMDTTTNPIINGKTPDTIYCGYGYTIVLMTDGTIWGTGYNIEGQIGFEPISPYRVTSLTLMPNDTGKTPKYIYCGEFHTIVLMTDGTIYGTGANGSGQLGISSGNTTSVSVLTQMDTTTNPTINGKTPDIISCGVHYTIVLMTDGTISGTGNNTHGQLGISSGNTTSVSALTLMYINTMLGSGTFNNSCPP